MTETPRPTTPAEMIGGTFHLIRGTRYQGEWTIATAEAHDAEWIAITSTDGAAWFVRLADVFATEAEARAECKARRQPRRPRTPQPLYGDYALLAGFHGISTDGTGTTAKGRK